MKLENLFHGVEISEKIHWHPRRPVGKVTCDSRALEVGDVFVACRGARVDGHDFLPEVLHAKPAAVVFEHAPEISIPPEVTAVRVPNSRACFTELLNCFYGHPSRKVKLIGVTGTNGKTTIAYLLHRLLRERTKTAYLGTLWYELPSRTLTSPNTTPGPEILIPLLHDMSESGVTFCVMEVSSHALEQYRVHGLEFELAIFTQLTQDHLDYHKDLESYFQAKRKLFVSRPQPRKMLLNSDCPYGRRLLEEIPGARSYSLCQEADYCVTGVDSSFQGSFFDFHRGARQSSFQIRLPMPHNVANALTLLGALDLLGYDPDDFRDELREIQGIPGRMERVKGSGDVDVFVDYAHTPDAFANVLGSARAMAPRRILCLFGCGGDRDRLKRPLMAKIASQYADLLVLTSDNPRSEDPQDILEDMKKGLPSEGQGTAKVFEIPDRKMAIEKIIALAEPGDVVLILGKGHEDYQILGDRKIPFDDRQVAEACLKRETRVFLS